MTRHLIIAILCAALLPGVARAQTYDGNSGVTTFTQGHPPAMLRAIGKAQATLPTILDISSTGPRRYSDGLNLKVALPIPDGFENIWVEQIRRSAKGFSGKLANEPLHIKGKHLGQKVRFDQAQIIDWSLTAQNGQLFGHLTTRVLLKSMPADRAQSIRNLLTHSPMPKGVN